MKTILNHLRYWLCRPPRWTACLTAVFRHWVGRDRLHKEIADAEQDYRKAVAGRDPDRVRLAAARLRGLRTKAGEA